jgi:hypothetical protein
MVLATGGKHNAREDIIKVTFGWQELAHEPPLPGHSEFLAKCQSLQKASPYW